MTSERRARGTDGFTLIEVLVAMVVLAVGLLGLEALGIGAARSIALAERQSGFAAIAADSLESALHLLRRDPPQTPKQFCQTDLAFGDRMSRIVTIDNDPQLATVTVRILPAPTDLTASADTFEITSSLYLPVAPLGSVTGQPCA